MEPLKDVIVQSDYETVLIASKVGSYRLPMIKKAIHNLGIAGDYRVITRHTDDTDSDALLKWDGKTMWSPTFRGDIVEVPKTSPFPVKFLTADGCIKAMRHMKNSL